MMIAAIEQFIFVKQCTYLTERQLPNFVCLQNVLSESHVIRKHKIEELAFGIGTFPLFFASTVDSVGILDCNHFLRYKKQFIGQILS